MNQLDINTFLDKLQQWATEFAKSRGLTPPTSVLRGDLHTDEAYHFLRALDNEIVEVNNIGECSLPKLHRTIRKPTEPCLFPRKRNQIYLFWREYITQVGAVARLVLDYGWKENLVALDPNDWEFNLACYSGPDSSAKMIIAGETKKTETELRTMLNSLLNASNSTLTLVQLNSTDGHKKYKGLLKEQPLYFWAVAPGVSRSFSVKYNKGCALREISDLPSYQDLLNVKGF